jgi:hypothetical protein
MEDIKHLPRAAVDDAFAADRPCPICDTVALTVEHLEDLPDYVQCSSCDSAFILDAHSEMAMYGSISADYPATQEYALKRWVALEAVQVKASAERIPAAKPDLKPPTPPFGIGRAGGEDAPAPTPAFDRNQLEDLKPEQAQPAPEELPRQEPTPVGDQREGPIEPEPGQRFRAIIAASKPILPRENCSHCLRQPAPRRIEVTGDYEGALPFEIPLCQVCYRRATAKTEEEQTARLIAHLSAALIAAVLIVLALAIGLIDLRGNLLVGLLLTVALGAIGYGLPARALLNRRPTYRPPADAMYVQTTLQIQPGRDADRLAFSWRNPRYAARFHASNSEAAEGEVTKVFESGRLSDRSTA